MRRARSATGGSATGGPATGGPAIGAAWLETWLWPAALLFGLLAGAAYTVGMSLSPALGVGVILLLCVLPFALFHGVEWGLPAVLLAIVAFEEFPSGLGEVGEAAVERSTRTAFYAKSLGVGGVYAPDVLIFGVLALLVFDRMLLRRWQRWRPDPVGIAVLLLVFAAALSSVLSILTGDPFATVIPQDDSTVLYALNQRALALIAVFQMKNYGMMPVAYLCGLLYLDRPGRLDRLLRAFLAGMLLLCTFGIIRLVLQPAIVLRADPLFYDSPSSWFFALVCFYAVLGWAFRVDRPRVTALLGALSSVLVLFILVSYRRTMWGGIAIASGAVLLSLPGRAKLRLVLGGGAAVAVLAVLVLLSPVGAALAERVAGRVDATGIQDLSTLYRVALFVHFFNDTDATPFFGYGVRPLWDKLVSFGYLRFNLENVHSLYFWLWLRTGPFGIAVAGLAFLGILWRAVSVFVRSRDGEVKALSICLLAAVFLFLFSGVFNPTYGEVRYMLPLGLMLAVLTRIGQRGRRAAPAAGAA